MTPKTGPLVRQKRQALSAADVAAFDQNLRMEEGRLALLLGNFMNGSYMPTRDQIIQLITTIITLGLMMTIGPALGPNATAIQSFVKQIVPLIVTATVHYAADSAVPVKPIEAPITNVQLAPVVVPQSPAIANI